MDPIEEDTHFYFQVYAPIARFVDHYFAVGPQPLDRDAHAGYLPRIVNATTPDTPPRIVITGAPASGKTEFFERLKGISDLSGFIFFEELARQLLLQDPGYRTRWSEFHREIYRRQTEREKQAGNRPFITDRGTADAFAFHPETVRDVGTSLAAEHARYTAVVQLGSSAGLGPEFYPQDDIRIEQVEQVLRLEAQTQHVWQGHPNYHFVPAEPSFEAKYQGFLALILLLTGKIAGTN